MKIERPSLVKILRESFKRRDCKYDYKKCIEKTHTNLKHGYFTRLLDDYPSLITKEDVEALGERYIDILRRLPENDISETFKIAGNAELKNEFSQLLKDIAMIGSQEIFDYSPRAPLTTEQTSELKDYIYHDLKIAIQKHFNYRETQNYYFLNDRDQNQTLQLLINRLLKCIDEGRQPNQPDERIIEEVHKTLCETFFSIPPENNNEFIRASARRKITEFAQQILAVSKKDYPIFVAKLVPELRHFLQLGNIDTDEVFKKYHGDVMISYISGVMVDVFTFAKEYNILYPKAQVALSTYLNEIVAECVKDAMHSPDRTLDLSCRSAAFRNALYYPVEHKTETALGVGATLTFGVAGFAGFFLTKALAGNSNNGVEALEAKCFKDHRTTRKL